MILEVMQHRYLSESTDEMALKLQQFIAAAERGDPQYVNMLAAEQVDAADLAVALGRLEEVAAALASPHISHDDHCMA